MNKQSRASNSSPKSPSKQAVSEFSFMNASGGLAKASQRGLSPKSPGKDPPSFALSSKVDFRSLVASGQPRLKHKNSQSLDSTQRQRFGQESSRDHSKHVIKPAVIAAQEKAGHLQKEILGSQSPRRGVAPMTVQEVPAFRVARRNNKRRSLFFGKQLERLKVLAEEGKMGEEKQAIVKEFIVDSEINIKQKLRRLDQLVQFKNVNQERKMRKKLERNRLMALKFIAILKYRVQKRRESDRNQHEEMAKVQALELFSSLQRQRTIHPWEESLNPVQIRRVNSTRIPTTIRRGAVALGLGTTLRKPEELEKIAELFEPGAKSPENKKEDPMRLPFEMLDDQIHPRGSIQEITEREQPNATQPATLHRAESLKSSLTAKPIDSKNFKISRQPNDLEGSSLMWDVGGQSTEPTSKLGTRSNSPRILGSNIPQTGPTARFYRVLKEKNINITDLKKKTLGYISHGNNYSTKKEEQRLKVLYKDSGNSHLPSETFRDQKPIEVRRDRILSSTLKLQKLKLLEAKEQEEEEMQKRSRDNRRQRAVQGILAGQKGGSFHHPVALFTERQSEDDKQRVQANKRKYFYESLDGKPNLYKFDQYAQEVLYLDISKYMVTQEADNPQNRLGLLDNRKFALKDQTLSKVSQKLVSDWRSFHDHKEPEKLAPNLPFSRRPPVSEERRHLQKLLSQPQHPSLRPVKQLPDAGSPRALSASEGSRDSSVSIHEQTLSRQFLLLQRLPLGDNAHLPELRQKCLEKIWTSLSKIN